MGVRVRGGERERRLRIRRARPRERGAQHRERLRARFVVRVPSLRLRVEGLRGRRRGPRPRRHEAARRARPRAAQASSLLGVRHREHVVVAGVVRARTVRREEQVAGIKGGGYVRIYATDVEHQTNPMSEQTVE